MERRLLLAVVLMTAAILFTNLLFPPPEPPEVSEVSEPVPSASPSLPAISAPVPTQVSSLTPPANDSVVVTSELYRYVFATRGGALLRAELLSYPSYSDAAGSVQLIPEGTKDFLGHRLAIGADTVDLSTLPFEPSVRTLSVGSDPGANEVHLVYEDPDGFAVSFTHRFLPDSYLIETVGRVEGTGGRAGELLTQLGPVLEVHEHPDHHSERELAAVLKPVVGGVDRILFRRQNTPQRFDVPISWAGIKDKYFLAAVIAGDERPLAGVWMVPLQAVVRELPGGKQVEVPRARITTVLPLTATGEFAFSSYVGPQDYGRLSAIGYDLEEVTPYGYRWLQPVIRPLAAAVLWVLNTLHDTLGIAYGWVLVIFGVMMRIVLWPLNARAMRAQMKNMALQPMIQELQEKHRNDKQKLQEAMLAFTKEHKFNPLGGCLPLLVPFPVLITLFFVFQNTIAFRGADFLWLPDLSLRDPLYILPIILVVSMFALQWVSARMSGMEQNPQMKMMMYMMPIVMGVIFFMLPSGLNLYYAVTQVASIPQQMLIAKERKKAQAEMKKAGRAPVVPSMGKRKVSKKK